MSSLSYKKHVSFIVGVSLVLGLLIPLALAPAALAADAHLSISGTVDFQEPSSSESCTVRLYNADTGVLVSYDSPVRQDLGFGIIIYAGYDFYDLQPGNYKIAFDPPTDSAYDSEWYNNKKDMASADIIVIEDVNDTHTGVNAYLEKVNATISGHVYAQDTMDPIDGFYVQAYDAVTGELVDDSWVWAAGDYKLSGFSPGSQYKIFYNPRYPDTRRNDPYMAEWYNNKYTMASADLITVTGPGAMTLPDVLLAPGGSISGMVTTADGGGIERGYVEAQGSNGFVGGCDLDSSGNYEIMGLPTDSYKVYFSFRVMSETYLPEWYNDKKTRNAADPVAVTAPNEKGNINAVLAGCGSITGHVAKDEDGSDFERCIVYVSDASTGERVGSDVTDANGDYEAKRIPAGTYKIKFVPDDSDNMVHLPEWYDDKADEGTADAIEVEAFETTSLDDASLAPTGSISGKVTEDGGTVAVANCKVDAVDPVAHKTVKSGYTNSEGNYKIGRLPNGTYKVQFLPGNAGSLPEGSYYVAEWWNNKKDENTANTVSVTKTNDTPNINASIAIGGGTISGNVKSEEIGNPPIEGCSVCAYDPMTGSGRIISTGKTDSAGNYKIGGLPAGDYYIKFNPSASSIYRSEWYDNKQAREDANPVTVVELTNTSGINALLETTGKISGKVISGNANLGNPPLSGCWVHLFDASTGKQLSAHDVTDDKGEYTIDGLDDGSYKVKFTPDSHDPYDPEWYDDKASFDTADAVNVVAPGSVIGINAALNPQTTIGPPELPASPVWYLPEGTTNWGFETYFSIGNPNSTEVNVEIQYMTENGLVYGGATYLAPNSQATVYPENAVPKQDFSTKFTCREGLPISVDRTMTWTGTGATSPEGHCSTGLTTMNDEWYLPEGSSKWGFETWLLVQNPNDTAAHCQVTYMIEGKGPRTFDKVVPANSRRTYSMAQDIGAEDASIKVTSDIGVIPERAMYRNNRREGHDSIGATTPQTDFYLAEGTTGWGFTTYVLVQNPNNQPVEIALEYMTPDGPRYHPRFNMAANSRRTIRVNDILPGVDFSTHVHGSLPIIAERAMYWNNGTGEACHDSIGMASPAESFYLADGQTSAGHETWTLVQNPNNYDVMVRVTYLTPTGRNNPTFENRIPANSRRTYNMADAGVTNRAAVRVTCTTANAKIMVERAMYWNNRGAGTDTIGSYEN